MWPKSPLWVKELQMSSPGLVGRVDSRREPAVGQEGFRGRLGRLPVALGHVRALDVDLARLIRGQLDLLDRAHDLDLGGWRRGATTLRACSAGSKSLTSTIRTIGV